MYKAILALGLFVTSNLYAASGTCTIEGSASIGSLDLEISGCKVIGVGKKSGGFYEGSFYVPVDGLDAGFIPLRTRHMKSKKFLDAENYKTITLDLNKVKIGKDQSFTGTIKIKGISKPVSGKINFSGETASARFEVNTRDFNIPEMSHLGITLKEKMSVEVYLSSL